MQKQTDNKQVLFEWQELARYFEKREPTYYKTVIILFFLLALLCFFFNEYLLIFAIFSLVFVVLVSGLVPPQKIDYQINKFGFRFGDVFIAYHDIRFFTVVKKNKATIIKLQSLLDQYEVFVLILPADQKKIEEIVEFLETKLPNVENPPKERGEKVSNFLNQVTGL